jgi:molybdopterin/thiamine biosynthesis adenylyltransferase
MLWQRGQMGQSVPILHLIDPDVVELKNVIRQSFAVGDVDSPKARAIALRYSLAYGLPICWAAEAFDPDQHLPRGSLLIDCTDNHEARRAIVKGIEQQKCVCLSNGNHTTFGQITLGAESDRDKLETMILSMESDESPSRLRNELFHPCYHLPHFGLIYPELLEPAPPQLESDLSCAELVAAGNEQHPLINDLMANVCASYIFKILQRIPVTTFISHVDLHNTSVTSTPITPNEIRAALAHQEAAPALDQPAG